MYRTVIVVIIAIVLAASHWKAYVVGKTTVMSQWQQSTLKAEQAAREKEQQLVAAKDKAEKKYVDEKRKAAVAASSASAELNRLRSVLAADKDNSDTATCAGVDGRTRLERDLLGYCATSLVQLAAEADRLETIIVGLQGYVNNVCLAQGK